MQRQAQHQLFHKVSSNCAQLYTVQYQLCVLQPVLVEFDVMPHF
uniref:Uncharacterized protein n=1 Tax=Arundo donax TaxID=35708 RepID=A0A0A9FPD4_ARUDO